MKPMQTQQKLEDKFNKIIRNFLCASLLLILTLIIASIISIIFNILWNYSTQNTKELNHIKQINDIDVCFNSSNPKSYELIVKRLNESFEKNYCCYDNTDIDKFELECQEYMPYNFVNAFNINSNQLMKYREYCLRESNDGYGYKNSRPCIVFIYLKSHKKIYMFPISIGIKNNFSKRIVCNLIYNNKTHLEKYQVRITNGQCKH